MCTLLTFWLALGPASVLRAGPPKKKSLCKHLGPLRIGRHHHIQIFIAHNGGVASDSTIAHNTMVVLPSNTWLDQGRASQGARVLMTGHLPTRFIDVPGPSFIPEDVCSCCNTFPAELGHPYKQKFAPMRRIHGPFRRPSCVISLKSLCCNVVRDTMSVSDSCAQNVCVILRGTDLQ